MIDNRNSNIHIGDILHGYTVKKIKYIEQLSLHYYFLEHNKTKATHIHISSEDKDNCFAVTFRTTPQDSSGVAHILEHTVLCGSKKYPVRDPFFSMIKRSLNTFMNAMTSSDWTSYPFSSWNKTDFYNLMDIYLDAAFNPLLTEFDFMQEGHRLEFNTLGDIKSGLVRKGVVFNEMKGAMSDPRRIMRQSIQSSLFTNTYHHNSGGLPSEITLLTHEELVAFHQRYYHPSNSNFYTYGDLPLEEHLRRINETVLSHYNAIDPKSDVPNEKRFSEPKKMTYYYKADEISNNHIALAWLTAKVTEIEELFALSVLEELLLGHSGSIMQKELLESKLGTTLSAGSGLNSSLKEMYFSFGLEGVSDENKDKVVKLINDTLENVAINGVAQDEIDAALHQIEFSIRDINSGSYPYSINLLFQMLDLWIHNADPLQILDADKTLENCKKQFNDPTYVSRLINKYFINNPHKVEVLLAPNKQFSEELENNEKKALFDLERKLTDEEKIKIDDNAKILKERQEKKDDLSVLPNIHINDIDRKTPETFIAKKSIYKDIELSSYQHAANGIVNIKFLYNCDMLNEEERKFLPIFTLLLTRCGTKDSPYYEISKKMSRYTGSLGTTPKLISKVTTPDDYSLNLILSGSCLDENIVYLFELMKQFITNVDFNDRDIIKTVLKKAYTSLKSDVVSSGHIFAAGLASRTLTPSSAEAERLSGMSFFHTLRKLANDDSYDDLIKMLLTIRDKIFNTKPEKGFIFGLPDEKLIEEYISEYLLPKDMQSRNILKTKNEFQIDLNRENEAWVTETPVSYVAKVFKTVNQTDIDAPALKILSNIIGLMYLHPEIREKGGAYGGMCKYSVLNGLFSFISYRDPHCLRTINIFDSVLKFIETALITEQDIEEIKIKVLGELEITGTALSKSTGSFLSELKGINPEIRQKFRDGIFNADLNTVLNVAKKYLSDSSPISVITSDNILEKEKINSLKRFEV